MIRLFGVFSCVVFFLCDYRLENSTIKISPLLNGYNFFLMMHTIFLITLYLLLKSRRHKDIKKKKCPLFFLLFFFHFSLHFPFITICISTNKIHFTSNYGLNIRTHTLPIVSYSKGFISYSKGF